MGGFANSKADLADADAVAEGDVERPSRNKREGGFVSVEVVVAFAFSLLTLTALTNLILIQYGRGIVRAAADESARAGARVYDGDDPKASKSITACRQRQQDVLQGLGKMGQLKTNTCQVVNGRIVTTVQADFKGWLPGFPTISDTARASSVKEQAPK